MQTTESTTPVETPRGDEYGRQVAYEQMEEGSDDEYTNDYMESSTKRRRRDTRSCRVFGWMVG